MSYRVIYGETMPAWEREFPTRSEARAFAKEQKACGDIIFSIAKVTPNDSPTRSLAAMLAAGIVTTYRRREKR